MLNQVFWTIDNELGDERFERLSIDLLYRNGYKDIVPIEHKMVAEMLRSFLGRVGDETGALRSSNLV